MGDMDRAARFECEPSLDRRPLPSGTAIKPFGLVSFKSPESSSA